MNSYDSEPVYMSALRDFIKGHDLDLQIIRIDTLSGMLLLKLFSRPGTAKASSISINDLKEIALPMVRRATPSIRRIVIKDMRTANK